jgi:hypothetical protein
MYEREGEAYAYRTVIRTVPAFGPLRSNAKSSTGASLTTNDSGSIRRANTMWGSRVLAVCNGDAICQWPHVDSLVVKKSSTTP